MASKKRKGKKTGSKRKAAKRKPAKVKRGNYVPLNVLQDRAAKLQRLVARREKDPKKYA